MKTIINLGFKVAPESGRIDKEKMRKLFEILGEGEHWWYCIPPDKKARIWELWPEDEDIYRSCVTHPAWRKAYVVKFGELYQESSVCPFCGADPNKCIHFEGPSFYRNGLFRFYSRRHYPLKGPLRGDEILYSYELNTQETNS